MTNVFYDQLSSDDAINSQKLDVESRNFNNWTLTFNTFALLTIPGIRYSLKNDNFGEKYILSTLSSLYKINTFSFPALVKGKDEFL